MEEGAKISHNTKPLSFMLKKYTSLSNGSTATPKYVELKVLSCKGKINPLPPKTTPEKNSIKPYQCAVITLPKQSTPLQNADDDKTFTTNQDEGVVSSLKVENAKTLISANTMGQRQHYSCSSSGLNKFISQVLVPKVNSFISIDEDSTNQLMSPSARWLSQPRSYRGAKRDIAVQRKLIRKVSIWCLNKFTLAKTFSHLDI